MKQIQYLAGILMLAVFPGSLFMFCDFWTALFCIVLFVVLSWWIVVAILLIVQGCSKLVDNTDEEIPPMSGVKPPKE